MPTRFPIGRRGLGLALGGALLPRCAAAQDRRSTLVLAIDIVDAATFDPARQINYTPPLTLGACYDTLVTMAPGRYGEPVPLLAARWAPTPDATGWRFTLRPEARFASGSRVTPGDCAFSLNRLIAIGDPPGHYVENIVTAVASGDDTIDILLRDPARSPLEALCAPTYAILEQAAVEAQGGTALPNAREADRATAWLDQHSAGSGAYVLQGWERRRGIDLAANPSAWRGQPAYARVAIRHVPDSTTQLRAIQRGDADAAFNLIPAHVAQLQTDPAIRIDSTRSLDFVFLALTGSAERSKALALREARQAIGYAIDYDDVLGRLLGGLSTRPATFLPVGMPASTEATMREIGFRQDLDLARNLLAKAGLADGFTFELSYSDTAVAGLTYEALARKLRSDLARIGIAVRLAPTNPYSFRDAFMGGKLQAALSFWTSPIVADDFWAQASVERLFPRLGIEAPAALRDLIARAAAESDPAERIGLWLDYQKAMVSLANLLVLFQPTYQVAVRRSVAALPLTAAGWLADLGAAKPSG